MGVINFKRAVGAYGFKSFFHRNALLFKILLSYIIIGSLLISILSTILFKKFSEDSLQGITSMSDKVLEQAYRVTDTLWVSTYKSLYQQYNTDNIITNALYTNNLGPFDYREFSKKLVDIVDSNNFIYSIYLYNSKLDVFFSNLAPMASKTDFYDQDIVGWLDNYQAAQNSNLLYRKLKYKLAAEMTDKNVITVIFCDERSKCALIYNLDLLVLQQMVIPESAKDTGELFIMNHDGLVLSHSQAGMVYENVKAEGFISDILAVSNESGDFTTHIKGEKSIVTYKKWDRLGWVFISVGSYKKLFSKVTELQKNIFVITLVFILLSIVIASFFIGTIYTPLYRLLRKIRSNNKNQELNSLNEYDFLKNTYENLVNNVDRLELFEKNNKQILKENILNKLLYGELTRQDEIEKYIRDLKINLRNENCTAFVFRVDDFATVAASRSSEDMNLYRYAVCNIATELFGAGWSVEAVDSGEDHIVIILNILDQDGFKPGGIRDIAASVQLNVEKYLGLSLTTGIGTVAGDLSEIKHAYKNALAASNYRMVRGKGTIIDYAEIAALNQEDYEYPIELEKKLVDSIKTGDEQKVLGVLYEIIKQISTFSYDGILLALTQVALVSVRTCVSIVESGETEGLNIDFKTIHSTFANFDTLEQAKNWFVDYYKKALGVIRKRRENKYDDIVQKIIGYIGQNFANPEISVEMLSDLAGLSPNYLRTIFKERVGKSISSYLNDVRFGKAQYYLKETDFPANRIAEMVGFQGGAYFYTSFKKVTGFSPDEYRKKYTSGHPE